MKEKTKANTPRYPQITLKAARVNANLTQAEACELLGISRTTLISWESGKTSPSVTIADRIYQVYNRPKDTIYFG